MRADERSDRTGEVNSHNAVFASESGRKTIFYVVVVFFLSPGRTQSAPKRCHISLACRVAHHLPSCSPYIKKTSFPSNWSVSLFHLRLPVHRWDHGCVHYGHMLWRADCEIGGGGGVCVWEERLGGRVKGSTVAANDN